MNSPRRELTEAERAELRKATNEAITRHQAARDAVPDPFTGTPLARPAKPTKEQPR